MKIYLAGPIRGCENTCVEAFARAAKLLFSEGHTVFNPIEAEGGTIDARRNEDVGFRRQCFAKDTAWICYHADLVMLLPGWRGSQGASAEFYLAKAIGIPTREFIKYMSGELLCSIAPNATDQPE